jgi:hypothetical protein
VESNETPVSTPPVVPAEEVAQTTTFADLFPIVFGETWKTMPLDEAVQFRNLLEAYCAAGSMLREKFDADVWAGHSAGTVDTAIKSVRTRNEGKTPGKTAKVLTPAELLAKRLKK